jgi:hypothetical protein
MKPATATQQSWTVDALIAWQESTGKITPRFTPDERSLAAAVAAAYYFWIEMTELPARATCDSASFGAMWMGVRRVNKRREEEW